MRVTAPILNLQGHISLNFFWTSTKLQDFVNEVSVYGIRASLARRTIFIVIHGLGCVGSEVADEAFLGPEGCGDAACLDFAHFPLLPLKFETA